MSTPVWTTVLATILLISAIDCSDAQDAPNQRAIAALPLQSNPVTEPASTSRGPAPAQSDMRALLADPAVRDFVGLSENAWDFTDPNGVPGFGPLSEGRIAKDAVK
jgi:hypothetical protein